MPRPSAKKTRAFHWIPPKSTAIPELTVTRTDGTVDTLFGIVHMFEIEDGKTEVIGRFEFELWNPNETYTDAWTGMEEVKYYCDYAATATTLQFKGLIEKVSYQNNKIKVTGRSTALKLQEKLVTQQYSTIECSVILKDLLDKYGSEYTYTNVNTSTVSLTVEWYEKPFWECVTELCNAAGFDAYLDCNDDFHFIESGSVINTGEAIVHTYNLLEIGDFSQDLTFVKNQIKVYGATVGGIQIIHTSEDTDSQTAYGIRPEIVNDDNLTNVTQAEERGDYDLAHKKDPPVVGEVTGVMLASIQPAEYIYLSSPENNIPPNSYDILSYKHKYDSSKGLTTTVNVSREPRKFSHVMKTMVENNNKLQQTSVNPYEMKYSYNFYFDEDSGTHSNTEIVDGVLKPTAAAGTWISENKVLTANLVSCYAIAIGETLTGASIFVSGNDGNGWEPISNFGQRDISSTIGAGLKVKVEFTNADTQIDSLSIQHK